MKNAVLKVSPDIIAKAAECQKQHACLKAAGFDLCKCQYISLGKFGCLEEVCNGQCVYCLTLDDENICGCPVRIEIFNKYAK